MIAGFELPTEGRILLQGQDVMRRAPFERDVNTVFQDYALFPHLDVAASVGYGLMIHKVPKGRRAERVADALRMVRLEASSVESRASCPAASVSAVALARGSFSASGWETRSPW